MNLELRRRLDQHCRLHQVSAERVAAQAIAAYLDQHAGR